VRRRRLSLLAALAGIATAPGCSGALAPHANQSRDIAAFTWWIFGIALVVAVIVLVLLSVALFHPRGRASFFERHRRAGAISVLTAGAIIPLLILAAVFGYSLAITRSASSGSPNVFNVQIVAHQWWYEVHYADGAASTRNELRLPAGQTSRLSITSADVVHAVWIPQLNGQIDANPGQVNTLTITNPAPGEYVGHCAEFCGLNHTTMTLDVIVQPPDQLAAWLSDLRAEAAR